MQELYLVIGGELIETHQITFKDPAALDVVGVYCDIDAARQAWKAHAWRTVDNAHMRYFVVPISFERFVQTVHGRTRPQLTPVEIEAKLKTRRERDAARVKRNRAKTAEAAGREPGRNGRPPKL